MPKREFTNTELSCYQQCPKKWWFQYHEQLQPKATAPALELGDLFHQGMALYYGEAKRDIRNVIDWFLPVVQQLRKDVVEEERLLAISELEELLLSMFNRYGEYAGTHDDFEVLEIEKPFVVPVITDKGVKSSKFAYRYKLDMLIQRKGGLWIKEFKTASTINNDYLINLTLDDQVSRYWLATLQRFPDKPLQGVLYTVVRKSIPSVPDVLKNGQLSRNKAINTTPDIYLEAIKANGLNPADYADMLEHLRAKGATFIVREEVFRTAADIKESREHLYTLCDTIATKPPIWKSPTRDCSWKCSYRPLCLGDFKSLREQQYVVREAYHPEYATQNKEGK